MIIRREQPSDVESIFHLTKAAFANHPYGDHTEQFVTDALRAANVLTLSLVAEDDGTVVGHVAFSPVTISDGSSDWYGLGPVGVLPERQNQGIGTRLIREGLAMLKASGAKGCVLLGDPAYYHRFGFVNTPGLVLEGVLPEHFMAQAFVGEAARGTVSFHPAFAVTG